MAGRKRRRAGDDSGSEPDANGHEAVGFDALAAESSAPEVTTEPTAGDDLARLLAERARQLAQVPFEAADGAQVEALLCRLRNEYYAIELRLLRAVHAVKGLTAVPCTPPWVAGILNVRGEVVSVVDLATAVGLATAPATGEGAQVLLAELPDMRVGLLVDEVLGVHGVALDKLDRPLSGSDLARGVAEATITVLNLEQLLTAQRLEVAEEVS
jgi:purine-binding chemotaxis protein CheW